MANTIHFGSLVFTGYGSTRQYASVRFSTLSSGFIGDIVGHSGTADGVSRKGTRQFWFGIYTAVSITAHASVAIVGSDVCVF